MKRRVFKKGIAAAFLLVPLLLVVAFEAESKKAGERTNTGSAVADKEGDVVLHGDTSVSEEELKELYCGEMPNKIMLTALSDKLPPVLFPHKKHVEIKLAHCGNCHHKDPKHIKPCYTCHPHEPEKEKAPAYREAHHGLCHPCHKSRNKGEEVPPVKCLHCHKKENKEKAEK